jgi:RNA polymerase sigma-70 factor, ECF subfamily
MPSWSLRDKWAPEPLPSSDAPLLSKSGAIQKSAKLLGVFVKRSVKRAFDGRTACPTPLLSSWPDYTARKIWRLKNSSIASARRLIALAHRHIAAGLRQRVDPEDVVQSAYKSFFLRYDVSNLDIVNWQSLWGLLALITVRKCAEKAAFHRAERRDAGREVSLPRNIEAAPWLDPLGRNPTPLEAAVLSETVEQLLVNLDEDERPILEMSLLGHTTKEISERLGRAERTVRLLRERVRHRLERTQRESS